MKAGNNSLRRQSNVNDLIVRMFTMKGLSNLTLVQQSDGVRVGMVLLTNVTEATKFINHYLAS